MNNNIVKKNVIRLIIMLFLVNIGFNQVIVDERIPIKIFFLIVIVFSIVEIIRTISLMSGKSNLEIEKYTKVIYKILGILVFIVFLSNIFFWQQENPDMHSLTYFFIIIIVLGCSFLFLNRMSKK